jgi:hypothetical protein
MADMHSKIRLRVATMRSGSRCRCCLAAKCAVHRALDPQQPVDHTSDALSPRYMRGTASTALKAHSIAPTGQDTRRPHRVDETSQWLHNVTEGADTVLAQTQFYKTDADDALHTWLHGRPRTCAMDPCAAGSDLLRGAALGLTQSLSGRSGGGSGGSSGTCNRSGSVGTGTAAGAAAVRSRSVSDVSEFDFGAFHAGFCRSLVSPGRMGESVSSTGSRDWWD